MTPTALVVAAPGGGDRARDIRALLRAGGQIAVGRSVDSLLESTRQGGAVVFVVVGGRSWPSTSVRNDIRALLTTNVPVIFVFDPQRRYEVQAPPELLSVNGFAVADDESSVRLVTFLRRLLGVDAQSRRVFLSYHRASSQEMAYQLRRELIDQGWEVFFDQFSIQPGVDFQRELFRDMDGRSLLLVIESDDTRESPWVDDEIAFANINGIGIRALMLPQPRGSSRIPRFPLIVQTSLTSADLRGRGPRQTLRPEAMAGVIAAIQDAHTRAYRARLDDLVTSVSGFMSQEGRCDVVRLDGNTVLRTSRRTADLVRVSVQRPHLRDLSRLLEYAREKEPHVNTWLVHRLNDPEPEFTETLRRVGHASGVRVLPLREFGRLWT